MGLRKSFLFGSSELRISYIAELIRRWPLHAEVTELHVDASGVGRGVADEMRHRGIDFTGVIIVGGETVSTGGGYTRIPKAHLIGRLQAALDSGDLVVASQLEEAETLKRELADFCIQYTSAGNAIFNAREGAHNE